MGGQATRGRDVDPSASEALRLDAAVNKDRLVEVRVPFAPGERVVVCIVRRQDDPRDDLAAAASSTLAFWDNPHNDEDWGTR